jgi:RNA polymerase sigma-70 factor (ECF subfamily)
MLHDLWEQGQSVWPGIGLDAAALAAYVRDRAPADSEFEAWLKGLRPDDAFLACACSLGRPEAVRAFDETLLSRTGFFLRSLRPSAELVAETREELLSSLFVDAPGRPPKIRDYELRSTLQRWLAVAALRTALNLLRRQRSHVRCRVAQEFGDGELADLVAPGCDPELDLVRLKYKDDFVAAFREAMASLPPRERGLLRLAFVDGLTPGKIAVVYGVHRTTAMRWIEAAQEEVLQRTRSRLIDRLGLTPSECDSIVALLRSHVHVTLSSLLNGTP